MGRTEEAVYGTSLSTETTDEGRCVRVRVCVSGVTLPAVAVGRHSGGPRLAVAQVTVPTV